MHGMFQFDKKKYKMNKWFDNQQILFQMNIFIIKKT